MNYKDTIKNNLLTKLKLTDVLADKIEENKKKITSIVNEIVEKDKKGEEVGDKVVNHRAIIAYSHLLNEDLKNHLTSLSTYYSLSKQLDIDLDLDEKDTDRLEFLIGNNSYFFYLHKNKIVPKDGGLFEKIVGKLSMNQEDTTKEFLNNLRKSKIYVGEEG